MFYTDANTPRSEIDRRISRLQERLQQSHIDAALILQPVDLYYFSGTIQQSHLVVPADGEPLLLCRKSLERARAESPLAHIMPLGSPKAIPDIMADHGLAAPRRLGLELDVLPANNYFMYQAIFGKAEICDIATDIRLLRAVKSDYEIGIIAEAGRRADMVSAYVPKILEPGISEIELAARVEAYARKLGHQGIVRMRLWGNELFYGHLMSGAAAAVPSYLASPTGGDSTSPAVAQGAGFTHIGCNEPVLVDYVFAHQGYICDHTRIYAIGPLPDDLAAAHEAMLRVQSALQAAARPGVKAGDLYAMALSLAEEAGLGDFFMGSGPDRVRFVGHGIGLELDEYPFLAQGQEMTLESGMVIALEPKCIFPGRGVVGIENTHVVTPEGLERLTAYPDAITVVELV